MNIIEAIKSGRNFRRASFPNQRWFSYKGESKIMGFDFEENRRDFYQPDKLDIIADDWEIEEKKVEITRQTLKDAFEDADWDAQVPNRMSFLDGVAKRLGLE